MLTGLLLLFLGPLAVRIWCELLLLLFRMNETLADIKLDLERGSPVAIGEQRGRAGFQPGFSPALPSQT